jgi:hypothetical protein
LVRSVDIIFKPAWPQLALYLAERKELLKSEVAKCVTANDQFKLLQGCEGWQRAFENKLSLSKARGCKRCKSCVESGTFKIDSKWANGTCPFGANFGRVGDQCIQLSMCQADFKPCLWQLRCGVECRWMRRLAESCEGR